MGKMVRTRTKIGKGQAAGNFRVQGFGFRVQCLGLGGLGFRVEGLGLAQAKPVRFYGRHSRPFEGRTREFYSRNPTSRLKPSIHP